MFKLKKISILVTSMLWCFNPAFSAEALKVIQTVPTPEAIPHYDKLPGLPDGSFPLPGFLPRSLPNPSSHNLSGNTIVQNNSSGDFTTNTLIVDNVKRTYLLSSNAAALLASGTKVVHITIDNKDNKPATENKEDITSKTPNKKINPDSSDIKKAPVLSQADNESVDHSQNSENQKSSTGAEKTQISKDSNKDQNEKTAPTVVDKPASSSSAKPEKSASAPIAASSDTHGASVPMTDIDKALFPNAEKKPAENTANLEQLKALSDKLSAETLQADNAKKDNIASTQSPDANVKIERTLYPLVILLHGATQSAQDVWGQTELPQLARENKFLLVAPNALNRQWNDGRNFPLSGEVSTANDVGYLKALIEKMVKDNNVDPKKVFIVGVSNGGFMATHFACQASNMLHAGANIASTLPLIESNNCGVQNLPWLSMNGTADPLVPFKGQYNDLNVARRQKQDRLLSAEDTFNYFSSRNRCIRTNPYQQLPHLNKADPTLAYIRTATQCTNGTTNALIVLTGAGHTWPQANMGTLGNEALGRSNQDVNPATALWNFFTNTLPAEKEDKAPDNNSIDKSAEKNIEKPIPKILTVEQALALEKANRSNKIKPEKRADTKSENKPDTMSNTNNRAVSIDKGMQIKPASSDTAAVVTPLSIPNNQIKMLDEKKPVTNSSVAP